MNDSQSLGRLADRFAQDGEPSLADLGAGLAEEKDYRAFGLRALKAGNIPAGLELLKLAREHDAEKDPGPAPDEVPLPRPRPPEAPQMSDEDRLARVRERGRVLGRGGGYLDAIPYALTTGALGNLPDYPPAVLDGIRAMFSGAGLRRGYEESLAEQRGIREGLAEKFPLLTLAGNLGGGVVPGAAAIRFVSAPTRIGRVRQATAIGGLTGAAQGFASGEGWEGRASGAAEGAGIGAAIGGAGEAGSADLRELVRRVRRRPRSPG